MVLDIVQSIKDGFEDFGKFIEKNFSEPVLWIVLFVVLLAIGLYAISNLADK